MAAARTRRVLALDALLIVACLFGLDGLYRKARLPVAFRPVGWFAASPRPAPVAPVVLIADASAVFRAGDSIRSVAGQSVSNLYELEFVCDLAAIGDRVPVSIERPGAGRIAVEATLVPWYSGVDVTVNGLVAAVFFALAILVTMRRPSDDAALLFHASSASFAILMAATWGALGGPRASAALAVRLVFSTAYALGPVLFVHFTLVFPRRAHVRPRGALVVLYAAALVLAAGQALTFGRAFGSGQLTDFRPFLAWFNASLLLAAVGLCGGIARLAYCYATAREESERRRVRLVVPGFSLSVLAFVGLWIVPGAIRGQAFVSEAAINIAALAAPLAFAAAIVRYHALDIDQILNRGTVYATVAAVLATLYTALTASIVWALGLQSRPAVIVASGFAAVCGVLSFDPVRERVQIIVDRTFFRVRYDAGAALQEIRARVADAIDEDALAEEVVSELDRRLQSERVAFLSVSPRTGELEILAKRGAEIPDLRIDRSRLPREAAVSRQAVEAGEAMAEADRTLLQALGGVAIFPFTAAAGSLLGLLVIGRKLASVRLSLEDLALLRGVAEDAGRAVERLRLREELREGKAEARRVEDLARARSDFVSSVSHELRTPLTSIRMFAELLRTTAVPPDRAHEYLSMVEGEADRLTRLIQNVLDFGRIERSIKAFRFQRVEADAAACAALNTLRYQLELGGFRLAASPGAPGAVIRADPDSFCQAIVNLVENAMKYSGAARDITVETRCAGREFRLAVSDRGVGIPPEDQALIFEPFARGSGEAARQAPGTGLGLSIVRHIMNAHSGRVEVRSAPRHGSTFTLVFPVDASDASHSRD